MSETSRDEAGAGVPSPGAGPRPPIDDPVVVPRSWLFIAALIAIVLGVVGFFVGHMVGHSAGTALQPAASERAPGPGSLEAPSRPERPSVEDVIADQEAFAASATTLEEVWPAALQMMDDTSERLSLGARMLAIWASRHMRWRHVYVAKDETSPKLAQKDSKAARGKRMCYSGSVVQIAKIEEMGQPGNPVYIGNLLLTDRSTVFNFIAAGSTGNLVQHSRARFCGIVTGLLTYANSGGGTTHAIQLVGMFKLPENVRRRSEGSL